MPSRRYSAGAYREIGVGPSPSQLHELIGTAFKERASSVRIYASHAEFDNYLLEHIKQVVIDDADVNSEMANANYDGVDEIYVEVGFQSEQILIGRLVEIELHGHVGLGVDTERPYAGHIVNVEGFVTVERLGRRCFGPVDCHVTKAELDNNWSDDDGEPPPRSVSQAYAELLGLELHEVGDLADVEVMELNGSSSETTYGYLLDFRGYASPEIARKILRRHSSLRIEVSPSFFDGVRDDDWPR